MSKKTIICEIEDIVMENLAGDLISSIKIICPYCQESQDCLGNDDITIRKCLMMLKEDCGCDNYLIVKERQGGDAI